MLGPRGAVRAELLKRIWRWALRDFRLRPACFAPDLRDEHFRYVLAVDTVGSGKVWLEVFMEWIIWLEPQTETLQSCNEAQTRLKEALEQVLLPAFRHGAELRVVGLSSCQSVDDFIDRPQPRSQASTRCRAQRCAASSAPSWRRT